MNRSSLVSIITATLNSERYLRQTIESVLRQTYKPIEYIVIDGGSTDMTIPIVESYKEVFGHFLHLVIEPEGGISTAFNKGIDMALGELVGIINSDDYYDATTVEAAVRRAQNSCDFVFGDTIYIEKDGQFQFRCLGDPNYGSKISYRMPALNHPTIFVKRSVYQKYGEFVKTLKFAMDYELMLRYWKAGVTGGYGKEIVAFQRLGGVSDRNYIQAYRESREISIRYGLPSFKAYPYFWFICAKGFARRLIESILPFNQALRLRRWFNKFLE